MTINPPNPQTPPKMGVRARERNALQRIEALEENFSNLVNSLQAIINRLDSTVGQTYEAVDAIVAELGPDVVANRIKLNRQERAEQAAKVSKEELEKAIADGKLREASLVGEGTLLVGQDLDKDGNVVPPGYVQVAWATLKPEYQEKFKDQVVGSKIEVETGTFEITGIYEPVPEGEATPEIELEESSDLE